VSDAAIGPDWDLALVAAASRHHGHLERNLNLHARLVTLGHCVDLVLHHDQPSVIEQFESWYPGALGRFHAQVLAERHAYDSATRRLADTIA
jgi:hypothetical protein